MYLLIIFGVIIAIAALSMMRRKPAAAGSNDHLRGQQLATGDTVAAIIKRARRPTRLTIGGVPVPVDVEDRGFLLAGSPGTGKSQAITRMLDDLQKDGHRAIVADPSGIFYSRYASKNSVLFNPFDRRGVPWSPLAEIRKVEDCAAVAASIIPDGVGSESSWNASAQAVLEGILRHCWQKNLTNHDLFELACVTDVEALQGLLAGTAAMTIVGNARYFGEVRPGFGRYLRAFEYLDPDAGRGSFSIREFITQHDGWLFVSFAQEQRDALKPIIQGVIDTASRAVLSLPPTSGDRSKQRRTWFILDELPLLGRITSLVPLLTNGSKHGSAVIAGMQTTAQMRDTYGPDQSQTILATLGTWLTLRVPDAETAEYMSKSLGDTEIRRVVKSGGSSSKSGDIGDNKSQNWGEQYSVQRAVMPSELQNLPDLCGYLNIAGHLPACPVRLPLADRRQAVADGFVPAELRPRPAPQAGTQAGTQPDTSDDTETETPAFSLDR